MPRKEDIDSIGAVIHLLGDKPLPEKIGKEDYKEYKALFTDEMLATISTAKNVVPSIDELMALDAAAAAGQTAETPAAAAAAVDSSASESGAPGAESATAPAPEKEQSIDELLSFDDLTDVQAPNAPISLDSILTQGGETASKAGPADIDVTVPDETPVEETPSTEISPDLDITPAAAATEEPLSEAPAAAKDESPADDSLESLLAGLETPKAETPAADEQTEVAAAGEPETPAVPDDIFSAPLEDETPPAIENAVENEDNADIADLLPPAEEPAIATPETAEERPLTEAPAADVITPPADAIPADELPPGLRTSKYPRIRLDEDALAAVITHMRTLSPALLPVVVDTILHDKLDEDTMIALVDLLREGKSEKEIESIFSKTLGIVTSAAAVTEAGESAMPKTAAKLLPTITAFIENYLPTLRVAGMVLAVIIFIVLVAYALWVPWHVTMLIEKGITFIDNGDTDTANRNFNEAVNYRYFFTKAFLKKYEWYDRYAKQFIKKGSLELAKEKLDRALGFDPRHFDIRLTYGDYYRRKGELEESEDAYRMGDILYRHFISGYDRTRELDAVRSPRSVVSNANFIRNETWATNVRRFEPVRSAKKLIPVFDGRGRLYMSWGDTFKRTERYEAALENFRRMMSLTGDGLLPRRRLAALYIRLDNRKKVEENLRRIETFKKGYVDDELFPEVARYLLDKKDYVRARVLLENILKVFNNNELALLTAADYYIRLKDYETAKTILNKGIISNSDFMRNGIQGGGFSGKREAVHTMIGIIQYNQKNYASAIAEFSEALKINANYPDAHFYLGQTYFYQVDNYDAAAYHYENADMRIADKDRRPVLLDFNLGYIYYFRRDDKGYEYAAERFTRVYHRMRGNPVAAYALGNTMLHLGRDSVAEGLYLDAIKILEHIRDKYGALSMENAVEFRAVNFLASLYNNLGVAYFRKAAKGVDREANEQAAFRYFVKSAEYFDLIKSSHAELLEERTRLIGKLAQGDIGIPKLNILKLHDPARYRNRKYAEVIDDYIPKDINSLTR
ncbi:MAG: tetratricopeptide repeat protein [Spirochaetes bacterium]|nr:tetratricopeptide repeat protein [Spirochaetota bacterium]